MKKLRIGLIGFGYWGRNLARNVSVSESCDLVMVADPLLERRNFALRFYPSIRVTPDPSDLISNELVDAVMIATPVSSHYELALASLLAGKHVWVEKPMTESLSQAKELSELSIQRRLTLFVDHTFIYTPAIQYIKREVLSNNDLGDLYYYNSTRVSLGKYQSDVNVISDLAVHDFSIIHYLFDFNPSDVFASGRSRAPGLPEDLADVTMIFQGGFSAHVSVNWVSPVKIRRIVLGGSKKTLIFDELELIEKIKLYDSGVEFESEACEPHGGSKNYRIGYRLGGMSSPRLADSEALSVAVKAFAHSCTTGERPITDGEMGCKVVAIMEAANLSMRSFALQKV